MAGTGGWPPERSVAVDDPVADAVSIGVNRLGAEVVMRLGGAAAPFGFVELAGAEWQGVAAGVEASAERTSSWIKLLNLSAALEVNTPSPSGSTSTGTPSGMLD